MAARNVNFNRVSEDDARRAMPIKFRCPNCRQFLGISRAKAGALTDCPTCGRTIRIPELDGNVKPLPKPALNLGDSELAGALDALAQLNASPGEQVGEASVADESPVAVSAQAGEIREMEPVPVAEPIAVEPALPPDPPVARASSAAGKRTATSTPADPLDELVRLDPAATEENSGTLRSVPTRSVLLLIVGGCALFGIGVVTGRLTAPASSPAGTPETDHDPADPRAGAVTTAPPDEIPAEPAADMAPALTGRLTYEAADGIEPDPGARVIVFPKERAGTAKLPVVGFRAGAAQADQTLARTSIRALGGDYTTADEQGRYTVTLAGPGEYHALFLSRFQPRDEAGFPNPPLQDALVDYFDRPAALIGPVAYEFTEFTFRGEEAALRDHVFQRE